MKKIVLPALLCVAYAALLTGYFSSDFSKEGGFIKAAPREVRMEQAPLLSPALVQKVALEEAGNPAVISVSKGTQGESAMK